MSYMVYVFPVIAALIAFVIAKVSINQFLKFQPTSRATLSGILQANRLRLIDDVSNYAEDKIVLSELLKSYLDEDKREGIVKDINTFTHAYIDERLPALFPVIDMIGGKTILGKVKEAADVEVNKFANNIDQTIDKYIDQHIDVKDIVEEYLLKVNLEALHPVIVEQSKKLTGSFMALFVIAGFLIGMVLMIITVFLV